MTFLIYATAPVISYSIGAEALKLFSRSTIRYIEAVQEADGQRLEQSTIFAMGAFADGANGAALDLFSSSTIKYLALVEEADGQPLEEDAMLAMGTFAEWRIPLGGACCLMTGPRTLDGALTPMLGPAPTGVNLVEGDYNRLRVQLDGINKHVATGLLADTFGQNNHHAGVFFIDPNDGTSRPMMSAGSSGAGASNIFGGSNSWFYRAFANTLSSDDPTGTVDPSGFSGWSRSVGSSFEGRVRGTTKTFDRGSQAPVAEEYVVGRRGTTYGAIGALSYSLGTNIDLEELDTRMTAAVNAIGSALS